MTSITPTVARVVWFSPAIIDRQMDRDAGPYAAIVCKVWPSGAVNLAVFDEYGGHVARQSVPLLQDGQFPLNPEDAFCVWMPYQKGQAAKNDDLVKELTARICVLEKAEAKRDAPLDAVYPL